MQFIKYFQRSFDTTKVKGNLKTYLNKSITRFFIAPNVLVSKIDSLVLEHCLKMKRIYVCKVFCAASIAST